MTPDPDAALGRRIGAALLDALLLLVVFVVVGLVAGDTESGGGNVSVQLGGGATLAFAALSLLYYGLSEAAGGQTLGKRAAGVRVVRVDTGAPPGVGAVVVRTLLRIVDSLPFLYLLGLIVVFATGKRRQRLGDLAAKTTVVRA